MGLRLAQLTSSKAVCAVQRPIRVTAQQIDTAMARSVGRRRTIAMPALLKVQRGSRQHWFANAVEVTPFALPRERDSAKR